MKYIKLKYMKPNFYFSLLLSSLSVFYTKANNLPPFFITHPINATPAFLHGDHDTASNSIKRDRNTKKATFISTISEEWELFGGPSIDKIDRSRPILTGKGTGEFPLNIPSNQRFYFELVSSHVEMFLAERYLPMEGGFNFRDLGGYHTNDGHTVQWGKLFRSDDLSNLTKNDLDYLSSIPLVDILDFRSLQEKEVAPDNLPRTVKNSIHLPITPGNLTDLTKLKGSEVDAVMMNINKSIVTDPKSIKQYREMFDLLQNPTENTPLLFHCTAGKDRTGMAAALILYALGVNQQLIFEDYLLSNKHIEEKFAPIIQERPELKNLFIVKKEFLQAGIDAIIEENESIENFLVKQLNVNITKFRQTYLE